MAFSTLYKQPHPTSGEGRKTINPPPPWWTGQGLSGSDYDFEKALAEIARMPQFR